MTSPDRLRRPGTPAGQRLGAWWLCLLLAALVFSPWMAGVHSVLHGQSGRSAEAAWVQGATAAAPAATAPSGDGYGLLRLFGGHTHDNDCRLFDQSCHADGLHLASAAPPVVLLPPVAVMAWHAGECLRRWATLFDARGPPLLD